MTDPPRLPDPECSSGGARGERPPGVPRWVKVSGIVVAILVLALVAIVFVAGGNHGPGRHASGDEAQPFAQTRPAAESPHAHRGIT